MVSSVLLLWLASVGGAPGAADTEPPWVFFDDTGIASDELGAALEQR
ncbi:MAG: hypothetical protein IAG13_36120, partial [Deltaproteobacteria bacterium]|nr:hypothetical protein [Nannocystaceae bacterium]